MSTVKVKVDNESGLGYFPKSIRDDGFIGELEGMPNTFTLTLVKPGISLQAIRDSLRVTLDDVENRIRYEK